MILPENHFILLVLNFSPFAFIFITFDIIVPDKFLDFSILELRNVVYCDSYLTTGQLVEAWKVVNKPLDIYESPIIKILQRNQYKNIKLDNENQITLNNYLYVFCNLYGWDKEYFLIKSDDKNNQIFTPLKSIVKHRGESVSIFKYLDKYPYDNPENISNKASRDIKQEHLNKPLVLETIAKAFNISKDNLYIAWSNQSSEDKPILYIFQGKKVILDNYSEKDNKVITSQFTDAWNSKNNNLLYIKSKSTDKYIPYVPFTISHMNQDLYIFDGENYIVIDFKTPRFNQLNDLNLPIKKSTTGVKTVGVQTLRYGWDDINTPNPFNRS